MGDFFSGLGEKTFRATQLMQAIYQHGITDFSNMTTLSLALRDRLAELACIILPTVSSTHTSKDGTRKWLLQVDASNCIETVFIPEKNRATLCISSQLGCPLNCSFCATGKQNFNRNLSVSEIIGQLWLANHELGFYQHKRRVISNVVLMGMGEPLLNFDNVVSAMGLMMGDFSFGLSHKRITLSTAGLVPEIKRLARYSDVSLAVSLHATNDALRNQLVPINKSYPIAHLMAACRYYAKAKPSRTITFEYVILEDINDSVAEAKKLVKLLTGIPAKVNLIPFNPFFGSQYKCSKPEIIDRFRKILIDEGIMTITRKNRGADIDAACGQLVGRVSAKKHRTQVMGNAI